MPRRDAILRDPATGQPLATVSRDYWTGTPIRLGDRVVTVRAPDAPGQPVTPLTLHRREEESGSATPDRLGGPTWHPAFKKYLYKHRTLNTLRQELFWRCWWLVDGAEAELRAAFPADVVDAVLAVTRDGADWTTAAQAVGHTTFWLSQRVDRLRDHIRRTFHLVAPRRQHNDQ